MERSDIGCANAPLNEKCADAKEVYCPVLVCLV